MNPKKIAEALRVIADALEEPFSARNTVTGSPAAGSSTGVAAQPTPVQPTPVQPQPAPAQPATAQPATVQPATVQPQPATADPAAVLDAQAFTTGMQTMAREVGSGVLHQLMPEVYTRYADGIQKYSAIKPENRQAVLDFVRASINTMKQAGGT